MTASRSKHVMRTLRRELNGATSLHDLEAAVAHLAETEDLSMTQVGKCLASCGLCLSTMHSYGSASALRNALRQNPHLRFRTKDAKSFPYLRKCLVTLR